MSSARSKIVKVIADKLREIDGSLPSNLNLFGNIKERLVFFDEVEDYPTVCVVAGSEARDYLPGDFKWAYLNIAIKLYVEKEDPLEELELLLEDIELKLDECDGAEYSPQNFITDIRIVSITTDEGVLAPLGMGEVLVQVRYDL